MTISTAEARGGQLYWYAPSCLGPNLYALARNAGFKWQKGKKCWKAKDGVVSRQFLREQGVAIKEAPRNPFALMDSETPCDSCLSRDATRYIHTDGTESQLCPACAQRYALWESAERQLKAQIEQIGRDWLATWGSVPGIQLLSDALAGVGREIESESTSWEGVRSFLCAV